MKGIINKTEQGWMVNYNYSVNKNDWETLPLHPDDLYVIDHTGYILGEKQEVEFEIVKEYTDSHTNQVQKYAKLINQVSPTYTGEYPFKKFTLMDERPSAPASDRTNINLNKMESKLDEVLINESEASLTRWMKSKRKEDDVEKLAEEYATYYEDNKEIKDAIQWGKRYNGFMDGYNKAKETLFTEEQLKIAIHKSMIFLEDNKKMTLGEYVTKSSNFYEELIQSLKQPKK
jgi:hypothetical protein